ncbi:MAG: outer membrane protein OmpA-like peptidoglycan-associated protein [Bacteroidia bacterium]|jgi:outer membrane protein OmpA-like peptidoglycan-associated protein
MKKFFFLSTAFLFAFQVYAQNSKKHSVYFGLDKHIISVDETDKLNGWLAQFTDTLKKIEIVGHTDYLDTDEYNLILSEKRANTVLALLESNSQLHYSMSLVSAKGEENSKLNLNTEKGNPLDRRVDIFVFQNGKKTPVLKLTKPETQLNLLEQASVGQTIVLKNLNFFPGRHFLIPKAIPELDRLAQTLIQNPMMEIEIQGHICCKLDSIDAKDVDTKTYSLSLNRAQYIHDQLVIAGVDSARMGYRGFAGSRPLYNPEITATHRNRNRRVEIKVLSK